MTKLHGSKARSRSCSTVGEVSKLSTQGEEREWERGRGGEQERETDADCFEIERKAT